MCVSTVKNTEMYVNIHLDLLKETSLMYVFYCSQAAMQTIGRPMQRRKRMNGNAQKRGNLQNNNADMQNVGRSRNVGS